MRRIVDTSILVRYLVGNPGDLATAAATLMDGDDQCLIPDVALAETFYVLTSFYRVPRQEAIDHLLFLIEKANVQMEADKALVLQALLMCRPSGRISVADALIWVRARTLALPVSTFDENFPMQDVDVQRPQLSK